MLRTKGVPEQQIEMFVGMMEKNPELFTKIAKEVEEKIKGGMTHEAASMEVMKKYEEELKKLV